jgi:hypothetical protein
MFATFCGSRCRSICGPATCTITMSVLICFISSTQESASSLSCTACIYMSGTAIRARAWLASQSNASETRLLRTSGFTLRKIWRSSRISAGGDSLPTRKYSRMQRGAESLKSQGRMAILAIADQFASGLETKPLQIITPVRFGGFEAANCSARGVENDSARSTNGSVLGTAAYTRGTNSRYERNWVDGYATAKPVNVLGSAARKPANSFPVPSKPGRSTKRFVMQLTECSNLMRDAPNGVNRAAKRRASYRMRFRTESALGA